MNRVNDNPEVRYAASVSYARSNPDTLDMDISESFEGNWSGWNKGTHSLSKDTSDILSLHDLCSKVVAKTSPFEAWISNFFKNLQK